MHANDFLSITANDNDMTTNQAADQPTNQLLLYSLYNKHTR